MKAIVTTSKNLFNRYVADNNLNPIEVKHVSILRDVQNQIFTEVEYLDGSHNVTDYVKDRILNKNGDVLYPIQKEY